MLQQPLSRDGREQSQKLQGNIQSRMRQNANLIDVEKQNSQSQSPQQPIVDSLVNQNKSIPDKRENQAQINSIQEQKKKICSKQFLSEGQIDQEKQSIQAFNKSEKQKYLKKDSLIQGSLLSDTFNMTKDFPEHQNNYPFTTKISALSQIKPKAQEQLDESLVHLTSTLKNKRSMAQSHRQRDDSLAYSNASMSNFFITPIKNNQHQAQIKGSQNTIDPNQNIIADQLDTLKIRTVKQQNIEEHKFPKTDEGDFQESKINSFLIKNVVDLQTQSKSFQNSMKISRKEIKSSIPSLGISDNLKLKDAELRRKQLQRQLQLVNTQIISMKYSSPRIHHNLKQRINISDDVNAKAKAIELVQRLNHQKKQRQKVANNKQIMYFQREVAMSIDEIKRIRQQRQIKEKEKKKIQVIQRMKQQQLKKQQNKRLQKANIRFLRDVIWSGETSPQKSYEDIQEKHFIIEDQEKQLITEQSCQKRQPYKSLPNKKIIQQGKTPQLFNKKNKLKKLRNIENAHGRLKEQTDGFMSKKY